MFVEEESRCVNFYEYYACGCVCSLAGAAGTTVTCPLEVVKTRLQASETMELHNKYFYLLFLHFFCSLQLVKQS